MDKVSEYLSRGLDVQINQDVADLIDATCTTEVFPAKSNVLIEGEQPTALFFIVDGIVRGYYLDERGNDITKCFSCKSDFFSSEGMRTRGAASFSIECLVDCECIKIPYKLVFEILDKEENLKTLFESLYLKEVEKLEKRARNLMLMNAEERYLDFCIQYPELALTVDLQFIASYIGIRAASLSRIRKKIKD